MPIQGINVDYTGQIGILPRTIKIICDDSNNIITTPGYLNEGASKEFSFFPTDVFFISYANQAFGIFQPSFTYLFSGNVITLHPWADSGSVILPVVDGHIAIFSGTTGTIADGGVINTAARKFASDNTKNVVASVGTPTIIGHTAVFSDTNGTIIDSGAAPSFYSVTSVTGTTQLMADSSPMNIYLMQNSSLTTLTLPASPINGHMFRIVGGGNALWTIGQNSGQIISFTNNGIPSSTTLGVSGNLSATANTDCIGLIYNSFGNQFIIIDQNDSDLIAT